MIPNESIRTPTQHSKHLHASLLAPAVFESHAGSYQPQLLPENTTNTHYQTIPLKSMYKYNPKLNNR